MSPFGSLSILNENRSSCLIKHQLWHVAHGCGSSCAWGVFKNGVSCSNLSAKHTWHKKFCAHVGVIVKYGMNLSSWCCAAVYWPVLPKHALHDTNVTGLSHDCMWTDLVWDIKFPLWALSPTVFSIACTSPALGEKLTFPFYFNQRIQKKSFFQSSSFLLWHSAFLEKPVCLHSPLFN